MFVFRVFVLVLSFLPRITLKLLSRNYISVYNEVQTSSVDRGRIVVRTGYHAV